MRFGVNVAMPATTEADPVADAVRAERLGFDFVSASDHLHGQAPTFEPWTLLTAIAASTSRLRVATRVLGLPYRHPAVVAKMAETLDRLSGGRLILGLGGGYANEEFRAFGLGDPSPRDKVDGLAEAIQVIRGLWSESGSSFDGRYYRVQGAEVEPKPTHAIPIWLGTYGPRALDVTGRLADGWIPSFGMAPPDRVTGMRDRVFAAAREAGRDPDEITCVYNLDIRVGDEALEDGVITGSPEAIAEQLAGFAGLGFSAMNFLPAGPDRDEQVERIGREILPALRSG
ncbi:MAG TPA: LLM class flavin-dependent oxidoreductase [Actinomycetota bacterium]|nr:LLM class flavin-dependent oxidoreductase [Actinomycetota bacterium]